MPTAEPTGARRDERPSGAASATPGEQSGVNGRPRLWAWGGLALVLGLALLLRMWGVKTGLPYIYNIDEAGHFVPKAVAMSSGGLNPHYFVNPPALTYVLHAVFVLWFGGDSGVARAYASHPDHVFLVARIVVALLGAGAVWLLYLLGARLFGRGVGLLAAALEAVAFLPVFYAHFALNDAATLLPLTLSLFGSAGILRYGRKRDYALAGLGLGFACASKYTAGIAIVPLAAATATHYLEGTMDGSPTRPGRRVLSGIAVAACCSLGAFLLANPYALLDFQRFHSELVHQSSLSEEAQGKLGAPKQGGLLYYLWSLTWGLGWAPALAALGGTVAIWRRDARIGWLLVPAPLLFLGFMGLQDRYFGRWLMPIFPIVCLLAAYFVSELRVRVQKKRALAVLATAFIAVLLLGQGLAYSVHDDLVLARADTRNLTRAWMVKHIPRDTRIVLEPVVLGSWLRDPALSGSGPRWVKYPALKSVISPNGSLAPQSSRTVALEDYEATLSPALIGWYERLGYCWVVTGSTESGRAFAHPHAAPLAVAYYRALAARAQVAFHVSPYASGSSAPAFNFDWTFDFYPLAYRRPGPEMTVYRLRSGRCM
jgi:4-amino-4-deoxy-L-arabinose transferase-like glycosyltransferase